MLDDTDLALHGQMSSRKQAGPASAMPDHSSEDPSVHSLNQTELLSMVPLASRTLSLAPWAPATLAELSL